MSIGKTNAHPKSGGLTINGMIEQYKIASGENISPGDFVEFVADVSSQQISTDITVQRDMCAVKLTDTLVLLLYSSSGTGTSSSHYLYGMAINITSSGITLGTSTQLSTNAYSGNEISAAALDSKTAFIAYSYNSSPNLYGMITEVNDLTITVRTNSSILNGSSSSNYPGGTISAVALSSTKVLVAHKSGTAATSSKLHAIIVSISGSTISTGTDTQLSSSAYSGYKISAVKLTDSKVFIAHTVSSNLIKLSGMIITVSDTTITAGSDTAISTTEDSGNAITTLNISASKVLVVYSEADESGKNALYGALISAPSTTVSVKSKTKLSSESCSGIYFSAINISSSTVFISFLNTGYTRLLGLKAEISEYAITPDIALPLAEFTEDARSFYITQVALNASTGFLAYGKYGMSIPYDYFPKIARYTSKADGIAATQGSAGNIIDVYIIPT